MAEGKTTSKRVGENLLVKEVLESEYPLIKNLLKDVGYNWQFSNTSLKLGLYNEKEIIAYTEISIVLDEANIDIIAITPTYQGRGLGRFLLKESLKRLKEKGVKKVFLEVSNNNKKALGLYSKLGFKKLLERKGYYKDGSDAIVMEKKL